MIKKLLLILLLFTSLVEAQHTVKGTMQPADNFSWIVLYQLKGSKQDYIANATIENGTFSFTIPKDKTSGIYRMVYNLKNQLFVDFIYDSEDVELTFNPKQPNQLIEFTKSKNNQIYLTYLKAISKPQQKLDSLQIAYFKDTKSRKIEKAYKTNKKLLDKAQQEFELTSNNILANHFIKASARYNAETPVKIPEDYLKSVKTHFFDAINFNNKTLLNSAFINDKINDFIFYMNNSDDKATLNKLRKESITTVLDKIKNNKELSRDIQEGLLYNFAQQQNIGLTNHMLNSYIQLPKELQDVAFIGDIKGQLKTAVGNIAPNILWSENNKSQSLHMLSNSNYYLVIFWSSTCSHCLKELPLLEKFLKNKKDVKVLAIGLETEKSKASWQTEISNYNNWTHIYGKDKWKNKFARDYGVNATPSFYILDAKKKILAKPDDVEELKVFLEKLNLPLSKKRGNSR